MSKVTPFRRGSAPVCNLRPIANPRITAEAMVSAISGTAAAQPAGMCSTRWRILQCIAAHEDGAPSRAALRLCSGLSSAALDEHVRALRWKGWIMLDSLSLTPTSAARMAAQAPVVARTAPPSHHPEGATPGCTARVAIPLRVAEPGGAPAASPGSNKPKGPRLVDIFEAHISSGKTPDQAAGVMGYDAGFARRMMERIARDSALRSGEADAQ